MILRAPRPGVLEWTGDPLAPRRLAWLAVVDHCALLEIELPADTSTTWRRHPELTAVTAGEPIALVGDDPVERAECERAEQQALERLDQRLQSELARLGEGSSPLQRELLAPERRRLTERLARLRAGR
ncbi:MAG: hypothetical protein ACOZQL_08950 [Myxococcota bacterium]